MIGSATALALFTGAALATAAPAARPAPPNPRDSKARLDAGMSELGGLVGEARASQDLVRLNCVLDKRDRADEVSQLATTEMIVISDRTQGDQARLFAAEKLAAAADRLGGLVDAARLCAGAEGPDDEVNVTNTDADQKDTIPVNDPAAGASPGDTLPPVLDPAWLPVASGSE